MTQQAYLLFWLFMPYNGAITMNVLVFWLGSQGERSRRAL